MAQSKNCHRLWWKWGFVALGLLAAIVGIPIGINECYKANTGYTTVWDGSDVLGYYGALLSAVIGATAAALTLAATISFNRKQIQRDTYLKNGKEKWGRIETVIANALDLINPQRVLLVSAENTGSSSDARHNSAIASLQKYKMDCKLSTDQLYTCLSSVDYPKVQNLLAEIAKASQQFFDIAQSEYNAYVKLSTIQIHNLAQKAMDDARYFPDTFSADDISYIEDVLNNTATVRQESVYEEIGQHNQDMANVYETTYRRLLSLKGQTFDTIYTELQKNADEILRFRRGNSVDL